MNLGKLKYIYIHMYVFTFKMCNSLDPARVLAWIIHLTMRAAQWFPNWSFFNNVIVGVFHSIKLRWFSRRWLAIQRRKICNIHIISSGKLLLSLKYVNLYAWWLKLLSNCQQIWDKVQSWVMSHVPVELMPRLVHTVFFGCCRKVPASRGISSRTRSRAAAGEATAEMRHLTPYLAAESKQNSGGPNFVPEYRTWNYVIMCLAVIGWAIWVVLVSTPFWLFNRLEDFYYYYSRDSKLARKSHLCYSL